jgi:hypothetical protein
MIGLRPNVALIEGSEIRDIGIVLPGQRRAALPSRHVLLKWRRLIFEARGHGVTERSDKITIDPGVCSSKPAVRGIRITVEYSRLSQRR